MRTRASVANVALRRHQDEQKGWVALPYEIASAFVRTLCLHVHQLQATKETLAELEKEDPEAKKAATSKARTTYTELCDGKRFIVMNGRTCHLATQDWVAKNISKSSDGAPTWKNKSHKKSPPWTMTMSFKMTGASAFLTLKLQTGAPDRVVRCWDLRGGQERSKLSMLLEGYEHMFDDFEQGSDAESSATEIGDDLGLEGLSWVGVSQGQSFYCRICRWFLGSSCFVGRGTLCACAMFSGAVFMQHVIDYCILRSVCIYVRNYCKFMGVGAFRGLSFP